MPKSDFQTDLSHYALVSDRITLFYQQYPEGRISTELVSRVSEHITFKAAAYRYASDAVPAATGWASEREGDGDINTVACLENTETSAIGRALANLGFTASTRRPSREEMIKATRVRRQLLRREASVSPARRESSDALQRDADMAHDVLRLLAAAERLGFPRLRANLLRDRLNHVPPLAAERVREIEGRIRTWLRGRDIGRSV